MEKGELVTISKSIDEQGEMQLVYETKEINAIPEAISDKEKIEQLEAKLELLLKALDGK